FDATLVDLADFKLPIFDEPKHPRLGDYQHEHTRKWSASVKAADAFVFVTPEYNYGPSPALINALTYL
ncbi:NADPH-dependent FMN reductase, partial [Enterobacter hormaechei]|uniref:NADPH-dependent FMN reductase n=1 Tax=Enterobacter hormaechei TaxID=158836 RepID=UPI0013D0D421